MSDTALLPSYKMKKHFRKIFVWIAACLLISETSGSASEPVRLFVKEVPLKILGKEVSVIAIEQADGTQGSLHKKPTAFMLKL